MHELLRQREKETEAVQKEKELVKGLMQICQELPQHIKGRQCSQFAQLLVCEIGSYFQASTVKWHFTDLGF